MTCGIGVLTCVGLHQDEEVLILAGCLCPMWCVRGVSSHHWHPRWRQNQPWRDSNSGIRNNDDIMSSLVECFFLCRDSSGGGLFSGGLGCGNDGFFQGDHVHRATGGGGGDLASTDFPDGMIVVLLLID